MCAVKEQSVYSRGMQTFFRKGHIWWRNMCGGQPFCLSFFEPSKLNSNQLFYGTFITKIILPFMSEWGLKHVPLYSGYNTRRPQLMYFMTEEVGCKECTTGRNWPLDWTLDTPWCKGFSKLTVGDLQVCPGSRAISMVLSGSVMRNSSDSTSVPSSSQTRDRDTAEKDNSNAWHTYSLRTRAHAH